VLPRVSATLAQIIKTSASTDAPSAIAPHSTDKTQSNEEPPDHPDSSYPEAKQNSNVLPLQEGSKPGLRVQITESGSTFSFVQLFNSLQQSRGILLRLFGMKAYASATKKQKHCAKFRKGAMIDQQS
jgi:hypothetical protein